VCKAVTQQQQCALDDCGKPKPLGDKGKGGDPLDTSEIAVRPIYKSRPAVLIAPINAPCWTLRLNTKEVAMSSDESERVARGFAFLDTHYPSHTTTVDLEMLDIDDADHCPLAMAAGANFYDVPEAKRMTLAAIRSYGFMASYNDAKGGTYNRAELNDAWRAAYITAKGLREAMVTNPTTGE